MMAAILCSAAAGSAAVVGAPSPLSPDQATALATAASATPDGSSTSLVDGNTVLAASTLPDAETSIEAGVPAAAAVGLTQLNEAGIASTSKPVCWANAAWHQWGTWPYQQRIIDTTYWCAIYNSHITYRTSTTTGSGTLCSVSWRAHALIAGGVGPGFRYFTNRASAGFSCPTIIPWVTIHTTHHEDTKRNDIGGTTFVGSG
jgi:hypothetical protein